jgi:glutathione S-transferase
MAVTFYCGSGSPYAWRVWLALEHKALAYELKMLSFSAGDLKQPEFLKLNPRGKVPVLVDGDFAIYESAAILDYLEEAYPDSGARLLPDDVKARARARRLVREADGYLAHAMETLVDLILFTAADAWDADAITQARDAFIAELNRFEVELDGDFFAGSVGAVDFTIYPMLALALRIERKKPDVNLSANVPPKLAAWMRRMEALPYFTKTYPPHWKLA